MSTKKKNTKKREQRFDPRRKARLQVRFRPIVTDVEAAAQKAPEPFYKARTIDMGTGGIALLTTRAIPVGGYAELDVFLGSEEKSAKILTKVTYCKKVKAQGKNLFKIGFAFAAIQDENAKKIADFVDKS